ncbi:hypothetical protein GGR54DRAFT_626502 [Hypoxylon sp. NC1633]|nr:hypothetical protein GGR54DRAFT_626502 [Hypoxylon sp. NC1633]
MRIYLTGGHLHGHQPLVFVLVFVNPIAPLFTLRFTSIPKLGHNSAGSDMDIGNRDKGETAEAEDIFSWAISSPYSPFNLQSLKQPHPNDAPHNYPHCFTFRDAFEDLLAVVSGHHLSDLRSLLISKHLEHARYFPWGLPVTDWASGLEQRGLRTTCSSLSSATRRELSYGLISPWSMWQMDDVTRRQPQVLTWRNAFPSWEHRPPWCPRAVTDCNTPGAARHQEADSEADLYADAQSEFATDSRIRKGLSRQERDTKSGLTPTPSRSPNEPVSQIIETPDGGKIEKTIRQRINHGETEVTTIRRRFNADGTLAAHEEEITRTWSRTVPRDGKKTASHSETNAKPGMFEGWFWTR